MCKWGTTACRRLEKLSPWQRARSARWKAPHQGSFIVSANDQHGPCAEPPGILPIVSSKEHGQVANASQHAVWKDQAKYIANAILSISDVGVWQVLQSRLKSIRRGARRGTC